MNILRMCARIKFEFGAAIFEVNDDVITLFVYKVLHSDSDLKLDLILRLSQQCADLKFAFGATSQLY